MLVEDEVLVEVLVELLEDVLELEEVLEVLVEVEVLELVDVLVEVLELVEDELLDVEVLELVELDVLEVEVLVEVDVLEVVHVKLATFINNESNSAIFLFIFRYYYEDIIVRYSDLFNQLPVQSHLIRQWFYPICATRINRNILNTSGWGCESAVFINIYIS